MSLDYISQFNFIMVDRNYTSLKYLCAHNTYQIKIQLLNILSWTIAIQMEQIAYNVCKNTFQGDFSTKYGKHNVKTLEGRIILLFEEENIILENSQRTQAEHDTTHPCSVGEQPQPVLPKGPLVLRLLVGFAQWESLMGNLRAEAIEDGMVIFWFLDTCLQHGAYVPERQATAPISHPPSSPFSLSGLASYFPSFLLGEVAVTYAWGLLCPLLVSLNPGHVFANCPKQFHEFESIPCFCPRLQLVNQGPSMFSHMARLPSFLGQNHTLFPLNR